MQVAVTGGSGFLGRRTLAALHRRGHEVRALVRQPGERESIAPFVHQWVQGDQYEPRMQAQLVAGMGAVLHLGMDWTALNEGPRANMERNVAGTLRLLEAAHEAGVGQFVFVSSTEVYGDVAAGPKRRRLSEADPPHPQSIYGAFKASIEPHLQACHAAYGMNASAWRPAPIYGVKQPLDRSLWQDILRQVQRHEAVAAEAVVDAVSVDDVAAALALAVGDEAVGGQIFNLVDVRVDVATIAELARRILAEAGDAGASGGEASGGGTSEGEDHGKDGYHWQLACQCSGDSDDSRRFGEAKASGGEASGGGASGGGDGEVLHAQPARFEIRRAAAFFDRHGERQALRRGLAGVADYLRQLRLAGVDQLPEKTEGS